MTLEGVLPVWKPVDFTSHDVVAKVRRMTRIKRIGHTGTLDPKVTGVLPLCIGRATRVVEYIQELPKEYEAELTIGYATDTEDATGAITEQVESVSLTENQVEDAVKAFVGVIDQVPPMYSAVKVDGRRLYELAREGKEIERKSRKVEIYKLDIILLALDEPYPRVRFRVLCSKGTYIRTLCADIGKALGYPAVMSALVRTSTGSMTREQCLTLEEIQALAESGRLQERLIPADQAVSYLPKLTLIESDSAKALQGRKLHLTLSHEGGAGEAGLYRVYSEKGPFLGIFQWEDKDRQLSPVKVFN
ncbi:tRNA pseudouridine(55) synthase TruB [Paenibacillus aurantius]|uniref:tRNA pseudouridine synthase B n=1 Tax=Paenibacillus aurantius TaxID=2918900 RepID=A0AA96LH11_9BACL|nr:tRNA pseudouridine(55) synthase TruB [Paenibacillus aurantius]WNQ13777.1 tRNA pseudouridine(55) synthase TruB [Paenibacillus aurantius]